MEDTEEFSKDDFGLMPVRVDTWGPFVFVNLSDSAPPLAEVLGAIPAEVAAAGYDVERMRLVERRDYVIECNWKVYVDNYLEGYHLPIAHPQLFKELDYDSYRVEEFRYYSKQHAPIRELKPGEELGRRPALPAPARRGGFGPLLLALPEHDVQHLPGQHVLERHPAARRGPHADDLRVVLRRARLGPGWESMQQTIAFTDEIQQEDIVICEQVQRGLRSARTRPAASPPSARTASITSRTSSASSSAIGP